MYIIVQYQVHCPSKVFTLNSDPEFSKQHQQDSANRNVT